MTEFGAQRYAEIAAQCGDLAAIKARMRIVLENGDQAEMRDNYLEQLQNLLHNTGPVDSDWLRCSTRETYFVTQSGGTLRVVLVDPDEQRPQSSASSRAPAQTARAAHPNPNPAARTFTEQDEEGVESLQPRARPVLFDAKYAGVSLRRGKGARRGPSG